MTEDFYTWLKDSQSKLEEKQALLGFDGFIDIPISIPEMPTMKRLSDYLAERDGRSGAFEINESTPKIGGNMPITANALGNLGLKNICIGAIDSPLFANMSKNCKLYPIASPGKCYAIEFESGKLMLANSKPVHDINYKFLSDKMPKLSSLYDNANIWCYLNWSEVPGLTDILKGLLENIFPNMQKKPRIAIFDLADFTMCDKNKLFEALEVMASFNKYAETLLTLNENEAGLLLKNGETLIELYKRLGFDNLIVRKNKTAYAISKNESIEINTKYVEKPKLMTGAGDNFNAGITAALAMDGCLKYALTLGTFVSSFYIANGYSPSFNEILEEAANELN